MKKLKYLLVVFTIITAAGCKNEKQTPISAANEAETITKTEKIMNVLFVLTSHEDLGKTGEKTGFWIEEFASPYYFLADKGVKVTIASPKGGQPPIDPKSELADFSTPATERYNKDAVTKELIKNKFLFLSLLILFNETTNVGSGYGLLISYDKEKVEA